MKDKVTALADAMALVRNGDTITTSGFVGIGVPDALLQGLADRFAATGAPRDLTLIFAAGQGDGADRGLNRLAVDGLLGRVIGGHWGLIPKVAAMATRGAIQGWNLPQGVISQMFRDIAAGRPGTLTHVGLGTFVDPRHGGGRINDRSTDDMVRLMPVDERDWLFYPAHPIHVALLRGTTADPAGNITMEREALVIDALAQAMAARNSRGVVIVQVERIAARGSLSPRDVVIPGALVDAVVVAAPEMHRQTYATAYSPAFAGRLRVPEGSAARMALDARKVIARRAAFELPVDGVVNLGIGMPEGVAAVAAEEGLLPHVTLTAEPGVIGGQPASGLDFGAAVNTDAVIPQNAQFDFYDGGGLDLAVLGLAEADGAGNVNVSRFGARLAGAGGFINISQNARALVFAGTFTAGRLVVAVEGGRLAVVTEGREAKFVVRVGQITFAGAQAAAAGRRVLYVTERAVFQLAPDGVLDLIEVAPGIDPDRDILPRMGFAPRVGAPAVMDPRIFTDAPMGLARDLLDLGLDRRIVLDAARNLLFLDFGNLRVRDLHDVDRVRARVDAVCGAHGRRVDAIARYEGTRIDEEVEEAWAAMVADVTARHYARVSRYSGSAFLRMRVEGRIGPGTAPRVFATAAEAEAFLRGGG
jgi:propionate CoA-transferase